MTVGRNRVDITLSSLRNLGFGEEYKMGFKGGEMVFHRMEIRTRTANVAKYNKESV